MLSVGSDDPYFSPCLKISAEKMDQRAIVRAGTLKLRKTFKYIGTVKDLLKETSSLGSNTKRRQMELNKIKNK